MAVAVDGTGDLFISTANKIRMIRGDGTITTIAGTGASGYIGDGGAAEGATFDAAMGVALDGQGNVYVADSGNNVVRKLQPAN